MSHKNRCPNSRLHQIEEDGPASSIFSLQELPLHEEENSLFISKDYFIYVGKQELLDMTSFSTTNCTCSSPHTPRNFSTTTSIICFSYYQSQWLQLPSSSSREMQQTVKKVSLHLSFKNKKKKTQSSAVSSFVSSHLEAFSWTRSCPSIFISALKAIKTKPPENAV